jgi:hypothetical protein
VEQMRRGGFQTRPYLLAIAPSVMTLGYLRAPQKKQTIFRFGRNERSSNEGAIEYFRS